MQRVCENHNDGNGDADRVGKVCTIEFVGARSSNNPSRRKKISSRRAHSSRLAACARRQVDAQTDVAPVGIGSIDNSENRARVATYPDPQCVDFDPMEIPALPTVSLGE
jgi:hypothetical protein